MAADVFPILLYIFSGDCPGVDEDVVASALSTVAALAPHAVDENGLQELGGALHTAQLLWGDAGNDDLDQLLDSARTAVTCRVVSACVAVADS